MAYSTVLLDLDHTLLDSDASEALAFDATLRAAGAEDPSIFFDTYVSINTALWEAVERGEISPNQVKTDRFSKLVAETELDADPAIMASNYIVGLAEHGELYPNALNVLDTLAASSRLALVTNGLGEVQRRRVERLGISSHFETLVISGEAGVSKPAPEIFDLAFAALGNPDRAATIMVGDSLSSDIRGGSDYGLATCWYNAKAKPRSGDSVITHEISSLQELPGLIGYSR